MSLVIVTVLIKIYPDTQKTFSNFIILWSGCYLTKIQQKLMPSLLDNP